jgi:NhaP-type Na+/H+ or K+/H+ antiporter
MAMLLLDGPDKAVTLHMTYGVVMFSIVVQGWSIARLFSGDRLSRLLR